MLGGDSYRITEGAHFCNLFLLPEDKSCYLVGLKTKSTKLIPQLNLVIFSFKSQEYYTPHRGAC